MYLLTFTQLKYVYTTPKKSKGDSGLVRESKERRDSIDNVGSVYEKDVKSYKY